MFQIKSLTKGGNQPLLNLGSLERLEVNIPPLQLQNQFAERIQAIEVQKAQAMVQTDMQLEQMKAQLDAQKQAQEVEYKKQLMELEFQMNMQLKSMEVQAVKGKDEMKEDRKDERTRIQASQQSELIDQRKGAKPPKNFESAGNDILGGGFDLGSFDPR